MSAPASSSSDNLIKGKRILVLLRTFGLGGAERQAALLANHLVERGAVVAVWAYEPDGPLRAELDGRIVVGNLPFNDRHQQVSRLKYAALLRLLVAVRRFRPDAVFPFTQIPSEDICYLAPWLGVKTVIWNQRDAGLEPTTRAVARKAWARCPLFVSNSHAGLEAMRSVIGADIPTRYIPNGFIRPPAKKNRAEWRRELGLVDSDFAAVMVANLTKAKDHATVIRAWRLVLDGYSGPKRPLLFLAGLPVTTEAMIRGLTAELGLEVSVRLLGQAKDVTGLLDACDLGVFSSSREGFPNGVLEPMAAGLAVVASDITGTREVLGDGNPGLVPFGRPGLFADRVLELLRDEAKRISLGERNRERVAERFHPNRMFAAYEDMIVNGPKPDVVPVVASSGKPWNQDVPRVTVLLPAYNAAAYLREAVDSVLGQTFADFELIVINDGSTDGTAALLVGYDDPRLRIVDNGENLGLIATLNKGLGLARGEYIARMDADDICEPSRFEKQVAYLDRHVEVGVCGGSIRYFGEAPDQAVPYPVDHDAIEAEMLFGNSMAHPAVMLRRSFVEEHELAYRDFAAAEDYELWARAIKLFQFHNLPDAVLRYRITGQSVTHTKRELLKRSAGRIQRRMLGDLGIDPSDRELDLHWKLGRGYPMEDLLELRDARDWLARVETANSQAQAYDARHLRRVLRLAWLRAVTAYEGSLLVKSFVYLSTDLSSKKRFAALFARGLLRLAKRKADAAFGIGKKIAGAAARSLTRTGTR
jgi:glycosyltransferase involved in cell wall biosynthesis